MTSSETSSPKLPNPESKNILNDSDIIPCEDGYIFNPYNTENVEIGLADQVLEDPQDPYTQLLVSSVLQV